MKKILRLFLKGLFGLLILLLIALISLWIYGVPKPKSYTVHNVSRPGWSHVFSAAKTVLNLPKIVKFLGFDEQQRLIIRPIMGSAQIVEADGTIVPLDKDIPYPAFYTNLTWFQGENETFFYLNQNNVKEDRGLYRYDAVTGETENLMPDADSVTSFLVSPDRDFVLCYVVDHEGPHNTVYRIPLSEQDEPIALANFNELLEFQCFDKNLEHVYLLQSDNEQDSKLYSVDLNSGETNLVFAEEGEHPYYNGIAFTWYNRMTRYLISNDENTAYYVRTSHKTGGLSDEFSVIWEHDRRSGDLVQVSPDMEGDIGHIALSYDERYLVYVYLHNGYTELWMYDRNEELNMKLFSSESDTVEWGFNNFPFAIHPGDNKVFFQISTGAGFQLCKLDLVSRNLERIDLADPVENAPSYTSFEYPTTEPEIGLKKGIPAFLIKPGNPSGERMPVLIEFHGGPDTLTQANEPGISSFFLKKGFAVIKPNYRGSAGYGVSFEEIDDRYKRHQQVEDAKALLDWIRTQPDLDDERVVLMGASWGGYMTLAALQQYPDLFLGGVCVAPVTLDPFPEAESLIVKGWRKHEIGDLSDPDMQAYLKGISPVFHADKIKKPVMIIQGVLDPRVPVESVRKVKDLILQSGGDVRYIEAATFGHAINPTGPLEGMFLFGSISEFVDSLVEAE